MDRKQYDKERYLKNREKRLEQGKAYRKANAETVKEARKVYNTIHQESHRSDQLERNRQFISTINNIKLFYKCQNELCQWVGSFSGCDLDCHHLDSNIKEYAIGQLKKRSPAIIKNELNKCCVLCAICHRRLHDNQSVTITGRIHVNEQLQPIEEKSSDIVQPHLTN